MVKKKEVSRPEKKRIGTLGSVKGSGTTYSCLYSTVKSPGTKYSLVKDKSRDYVNSKGRKERPR